MVKLPDWLEGNLPPLRAIEYITYTYINDTFYFRGVPYRNVVEAYEAVPRDANVDFAPSARQAAGWDDDEILTLVGNRLLILMTDQARRELVEYSYETSMASIANWRSNKDDFQASYYMLDSHPALWTRHKAEPTFDWMTDGIIAEQFWFAPRPDGGMMMEAGGHVEPEYTYRYHDTRLDTYGSSFEDCIVQTAALVDKFFHEDGTEREGVEYEKSELELLLEEAARGLDGKE